MKKNLIILAGMAVLISAVSCSIEENKIDPIPTDPRVPMTFTAGEFTKTSLVPGDNENAVHWSAGDAISIFDGTNNNEFTLTDGAGSASAKFEGEAVPNQTYYALYPYSETASLSGTTITSSLPAEQQYVGATFDTMLNPSVAVADGDNNLAFHNVASILQINVSGLQSKSVREIQISADKSLTGEYTVDMSGNAFSASASGTEISGVRLLVDSANMDTDQNFNGSISCYAVVLPGTYANLKISVIYSDNSYSEKSFENVTLVASDGNYVNVDASQATANNRGLYGLFMAGQDIYIGGKAYNKSQFTDSTPDDGTEDNIRRVTSTSSTIYAGSSLLGDGKIIFVDIQEQKAPLKIAAAGDIIVVGNDPENKPIVVRTSNVLQASESDKSRLILANLKIDLQNEENTQNIAFSTNTTFGELTLDNCDIIAANVSDFIRSNTSECSISEINIINCNIDLPLRNNVYIFNGGTGDSAVKQTIDKFNFSNNIIHCEEGIVTTFRLTQADNSLTAPALVDITDITLNNNTLVNVAYNNSAMVLAGNIGYAEAIDNLIYYSYNISENNNVTDKQNYFPLFRAWGNYPDYAECYSNIAYQQPQDTKIIGFRVWQNNNWIVSAGNVEQNIANADSDPFEGGDLSTFTPAPAYASYGAQR